MNTKDYVSSDKKSEAMIKALEANLRGQLLRALAMKPPVPPPPTRPQLDVMTCLDDREESFRRALALPLHSQLTDADLDRHAGDVDLRSVGGGLVDARADCVPAESKDHEANEGQQHQVECEEEWVIEAEDDHPDHGGQPTAAALCLRGPQRSRIAGAGAVVRGRRSTRDDTSSSASRRTRRSSRRAIGGRDDCSRLSSAPL